MTVAMHTAHAHAHAHALDAWRLRQAPYYHPQNDEVTRAEHVWRHRLPLLLKGPTGSGKTRFIEYMAWHLGQPLLPIACHDDTTAADLVGRWLLHGDGMQWQDGPLTLAARHGGICYLDEFSEANPDATVVIHPLTDNRRVLPLEQCGELIHAHPNFQLVISYNPGYQSHGKDLKPSTRQRFTGIALDYPALDVEAHIVAHEACLPLAIATELATLAQRVRALCMQHGTPGVSTRTLVYAATLIRDGLPARTSCHMSMTDVISDEASVSEAIRDLIDACFA